MSVSGLSDQLDLRVKGQLDPRCTGTYNRIANEIRGEYADFVGRLYEDEEFALDWWLEAPATRNPIFSDLFHQLVSLILLQRLLEQGPVPTRVMVDSEPMKLAVLSVSQVYTGNIPVVSPTPGNRLITKTRSVLSPYRSMVRLLAEYAIVRCSRGFRIPSRDSRDRLILIDTFAIPGFVDKDRYYPGLVDHAGELKDSIRFVPQFFNLTLAALFGAARTLRKQPGKYILKEDFLGFRDIFWCFGHLTRINRVTITNTRFRNIDVKNLVRADITRRRAFRCAVRGLMNYRFAKSLKRNGIRVRKAIDWFENHPLDRGWNAGFNNYYPESSRVGYTGFYPAGQSFRPTVRESAGGILPSEHFIIGEGFFSDFREFHPECKLSIAPAFRYSGMPDLRRREAGDSRILVAMPYYPEMCASIITMLDAIAKNNPSWNFVIKPHPARALEEIGTLTNLLKSNVKIVGESLVYWLERSDLMITGGQASSILEAAACVVPTVVLASNTSDGEVSTPSAVPDQLFHLASSEPDLERAVSRFLSADQDTREEWLRLAGELRESCFTPVTERTVEQMLTDQASN